VRYLGGKARLAKHLVPVMNVPADALYVEPFVGGANIMAAQSHVRRRVGCDAQPYLIALHRAIQAGWRPSELAHLVDKEAFDAVKATPDAFAPCLTGFIGFCASLQGAFLRGFDRGTVNPAKPEYLVNRALGSARVLEKQHATVLKDVAWHCASYESLAIPGGAWVYCDPPYAGTAGYSTGAFDSVAFWAWARALRERCRVFVSEFSAPSDWTPVWEQTRPLMGSGGARRMKVERLYV
jgi:DNA adenine methylase